MVNSKRSTRAVAVQDPARRRYGKHFVYRYLPTTLKRMLLCLIDVHSHFLDSHTLEHVLLFLLLLVGAVAALARRINIPYPILLVIAGVAVSFLPRTPHLALDPDLVLNLFLPPLLYAAAWQTNWREFRRQIVPISMLATGLVFFTVFGVALLADHFIPVLDFRSGFLLGAIVAATDAVAATSIARTLGLERRIVAIIEGESLLNDATALLALELGLRMLLTDEKPQLGPSLLRLVWLIVGGVASGIVVAKLFIRIERWIGGSGSIEVVLGLIVPYVAYLAAGSLHASGVMGVVACGLLLSHHSSTVLTAQARLQANGVWEAIDFFLNGTMFALIGLQLPVVLHGIEQYSHRTLLLYGASLSGLLIALRLGWVFPVVHAARWTRVHLLREPLSSIPTAPSRSLFIVAWTGMRGVVSLAAALSLPVTLSNGQPFAQRDLIIFLTFAVIFVTLVLQGLGLPRLIAALKLGGDDHSDALEFYYAMRKTAETAIEYLSAQRTNARPELQSVVDDLLHKYERQLAASNVHTTHTESPSDRTRSQMTYHSQVLKLIRDAVQVQRNAVIQLRDVGEIGDEALHRVERNLDLEEMRFTFEER
jgi:monovalent cation/hydrogen antiporter